MIEVEGMIVILSNVRLFQSGGCLDVAFFVPNSLPMWDPRGLVTCYQANPYMF